MIYKKYFRNLFYLLQVLLRLPNNILLLSCKHNITGNIKFEHIVLNNQYYIRLTETINIILLCNIATDNYMYRLTVAKFE